MRFSRVFIVCVVLFLAVVFFGELRAPRHFRWQPTFSHTDRQPFGCYVTDSILAATMPAGYTVNHKTLYQMSSLDKPHAILVVAEDASLSATDVRAALSLARRGHRLLLVSGYSGRALADTLRCYSFSRMSLQPLAEYVRKGYGRDTLEWLADSAYQRSEYYYYAPLLDRELLFNPDSVHCRILSRLPNGHRPFADSLTLATAVTFDIGRGSITLASTPLVFTNYAMLDGRNHQYVFRLLSQTAPLPLIRTEAYGPAVEEAQQTPLRYIISQRPLRWALYLALATLLVGMLFGCRRRQRAIPVVEPPRNNLLEFVRLMGTIDFKGKKGK